MKTAEMFKNRTVFSFEVFPPKRTAPASMIYETLDEMKDIHPDFISVTYGAGGNESSNISQNIAVDVKQKYGIESVMHLSCLYLSREQVLLQLEQLKKHGIENILALRGDINPNIPPCEDFKHANELVSFIKDNGDFNVIGACYPEMHPESANAIDDIRNLKRKVDAGADHLITQLFLDNASFYRFRERAILAGIEVPIEAGIMPVVNKKQIERIISLCGAHLPPKFSVMMERYQNNPEALHDAGIAYAINQIVDLLVNDVNGIHLYTMNSSEIARKVYNAVYRLLAI